MPRSAASRRGIERERALVRLLQADPSGPWLAMRAPGSLGVFDVIAVRGDCVRLIEVKSTKTAFSGFPPAAREALLEAAEIAGPMAKPELCWWPKNRKPTFIDPKDWP